MLKNLVKIANRLDSLGLSAEADVIDSMINKMAARVISPGDFDHDMVVELGGGEWDSESDGEHPHSHFLDRWEKEDSSIKNIITDPEHELYNPHNHGVPSYEMGEGIEDSIDAQISRRRELEDLEEMYPAIHHFRRSSSDKRGMRKRAAATRTSAPKIDTHLIREIISEKANDRFKEANKAGSSYEMSLGLKAVERLHSFLNSAGDKVYITTTDNYFYSLWLEDPLDPLSKADPRKNNGMAVRLTVGELVDAIGQDHLKLIKQSAREAGYIEDEVMKSGYGKWQFTGDTSELDMMGYTPDVLK